MEEQMLSVKDFLRGTPIQVHNHSVCVSHLNSDLPSRLTLLTSTSLLRENCLILRLSDESTTSWPTFMHELNSIPELANVVAFNDRVILDLDTTRAKSWETVAEKLIFVFRRALQSVVYKRTGINPRASAQTLFP